MKTKGKASKARPRWLDFHHTGPGTLAGEYLRQFWQPVYHSADLPAGRARLVKIMSTEYVLYRGTDGRPYLVDARCPHRGTLLTAGWIERDTIRCFYHGWQFDGTGQCLAQPAEPKSFAHKVRIGAYPCQEYLGLIFAYLGSEAPPALPRYPDFENVEGILEWDSYQRNCNYFNNAENGADLTHSGFVHRNNPGANDGFVTNPVMDARESCWGVTVYARFPEQLRVSQIGMPNVFHHKAQPTDIKLAPFREFLAWWVPVDDESHIQFTVAAVRMSAELARQYVERREARLAKRTQSRDELCSKVLRGELSLDEIDRESTDFLRLQDDVAQIGQGRIADHDNERLGQGDRAIILLRKIWARELRALAENRPLKQWAYDREALSISRGELWEKQSREQLMGAEG